MKTILNSNIVTVLKEFQEAVREGYRLEPNKSFLCNVGMLYELHVFNNTDIQVKLISETEALDTVVICDHDPMKVFFAVQQYVVSDYEIDLNSVLWLPTGTKSVKMVKASHPATKVFSKEELESMPYEEIKEAARYRNCFNRSKEQMIRNILKFQEERK